MRFLRAAAMFFALALNSTLHAEMLKPNTLPELSQDELTHGMEIFQYHCARCHGKKANGDGRFAVIYRRLYSDLPSDFTIGYFASRPAEYLKKIIINGGKDNQRSQYMPPYKDTLNTEEINILVRLIQITGANNQLPETSR